MTFKIDHLVHANVVCSDFDRSLDFYTRLLGARVLGQPFEFDAGDDFRTILDVTGPVRCKAALLSWSSRDTDTYLDLLHFTDDGGAPAPRTAKDAGLARLGLRVEDMDTTMAWITEHGIPVVGGPVTLVPMPGRERRVVTILDPDGTLLNLMEFSGPSAPPAGSGRG
ncbi:VOC family protein [Streptosporangium sp. NPDC049046]|uniref:VOC family protein n=1 Tax=unclassified Streptosporangium TaxID=2632669 RepID=UPI003414CFF5